MAFTYDLEKLPTDPATQVRFKIGDTDVLNPMLQDEEIGFALTANATDVDKASYMSVCVILSKASLNALDFTLGPYKEAHETRIKALQALKESFEKNTFIGSPISNAPTTDDIFWHNIMAISKEEV